MLLTDVEGLVLQDLDVRATRDGIDLFGCRHALLDRVRVSGGADDALGTFVAGIGDPNGDGREDIVLTAPGSGRAVILTSPYTD